MKTIFSFGIVALSRVALANGSWSPMLVCDNGAAVVDREISHTTIEKAQLVVRNGDIVNYFSSQGFGHSFGNGEAIFRFEEGNTELNSFSYLERLYNFARNSNEIHTLSYSQGNLNLDIFAAENPTGGLWIKKERIGGWQFGNCEIR